MSNRDRHLFSIPIQHLLLLTLSSFFVDWESQVFAQVVEDDTLGAERSIVKPNVVIKGVPSDRIDGGARRGANLFHSFGQFIIPEGRGAYFSNPDGIRTIFSRVTGGNSSQIFGTLGVLGNANLFLIDPKGIIFGANAKLDISGSFIGSTANGIAFPNGENFSATNPNAAPLLTIDVLVPVGLVFESDNSGIIFNAADLKNQQNLALIAGGILSSGKISAPGGNITLATVPGAVDSLVGLDGTGKFLGTIQGTGQPNLEGRDIVLIGGAIDASSNGIAGNVVLNSAGNTSLSNGATVNVLGAGGGSITVNARNLSMSGGRLLAGIGQGLGSLGAQAGNVVLKVAGEITLSESSRIENRVNQNAIGNAGDINVRAGSLTLSEGAFLSASTLGRGNGGDVRVKVDGDVRLNGVGGTGNNRSRSRISSVIGESAVGEGGNIAIEAQSLSVTNGALINTAIFEATNGTPGGRGNAGDIFVTTKDNVTISGSDRNGSKSEINSAVGASTIGNGGDIVINTGSLSLSNDARLITLTAARGNAGKIKVTASDAVTLSSRANVETSTAGLQSGNAGDIFIKARSLSVTDRVFLNASTLGQGNGGDITLRIEDTVTFDNNVRIGGAVAPQATGKGGNINIQARAFFLSNGAQLITSTLGKGDAGNILIKTSESVSVNNRAIIQAATFNSGNAGSIAIETENGTVSFDGASTGATTFVGRERINGVEFVGTGKGGEIKIDARTFSLTNGASLLTGTLTKGAGGNLIVNASESVQLIGTAADGSSISGLSTQTNGEGKAGNLTIDTKQLLVRDGALILTATQGAGNGGILTVNASESVQLIGTGSIALGRLFSGLLTNAVGTENTGDAGDLIINTGKLLIRDGSVVSTGTQGAGDGGNLTVNASESVQLIGTGNIAIGQNISRFPSSLRTEALENSAGDAGNLTINTQQLLVRDRAVVSTTTQGEGEGGDISINASDSVSLDRVGLIFSGVGEDGENNSGNIHIRARSLSLTNGSLLVSSTAGKGDAGDIDIYVDKTVIVSGVITQRLTGNDFVFPSAIASSIDSTAEGQGGEIRVKAESLSLDNVGLLFSSTSGQGNAGNISIKVDDFVRLSNSSLIQSNVEPNGVGIGGNVDIQARSLTLRDGSAIQAGLRAANDESPGGIGRGGNISINTSNFVEIAGTSPRPISVFLTINPNNPREPVIIEPPNLSSGLFTSTQTGASGAAGNIFITTGAFRLADGAVVEAQTANFGRAGDITIDANTIDVTGGAQIISATRGSGDAGDIMLKVKDNLTISGSDPNFERRLAGVGGDRDRITNIGPESGLFANTDAGSTGDGGNIFIENPNTATINDGAVVTVNSQGRGEGGQIQLEASSLTLDNGTLSAQSNQTGELVGNINLDVQNLLLLRNGSQISTTVGSPGAGGDGGRITINTGAIVAVQDENSDITANAFEGMGGNILISTNSIFGIDFRERLTSLSDITASSNAGFTGNVIINTSGIDPTRGLENLPQDNINVQVAQGCQVGTNGESNISFYNLGRGGVPPSPDDLINIPFTGEWLMLEQEESNNVEINSFEQKPERDQFSLRISCGK